MKCKNRSKLLCAALLLALPVMCEALPKSTVQRVHRQAPKVSRASAAMPYGASLNEEQSLRVLESEISRKLGSKIQESDYPKEARLQGWSGTTLVGVVVGADGKIKRGTVTKTSGFPLLDQQALRMLDGVTIWWIPQRLRKRKVIVTVPVGFYVRNN